MSEVKTMKEAALSLEQTINTMIDKEFAKENVDIDDSFVMACCDVLIKLDNIDKYLISENTIKNNIYNIINCNVKYPKTKSRKAIKALLVAALIALLLTIAAFGYVQHKYHIVQFSDHSIVFFNPLSTDSSPKLQVKYVPTCFKLIEKNEFKHIETHEYQYNELYFNITKSTKETTEEINTEYKDPNIISINSIDYIEYGDITHGQGIIWENNGYVYCVCGNIPKNELLEIALSVN